MAAPTVIVSGLQSDQADGNILLTWAQATDANGITYYQVQRSVDGINFSNLTNPGQAPVTATPTYVDQNPGVGYVYYYQVAAANADGVSGYSQVVSAVAAPASEMPLSELRQQAQQTADRVNSNFVTDQEWNQFIRLAMYELYDLLIGSYEDYYAQYQAFITTSGSQQYYPLPDGISMFPGGNYNSATTFTFTVSSANATVGAIYQNNNYLFTVKSTISGTTTLSTSGTGPPLPYGILTKVSGTGDNQITFFVAIPTLTGQTAPAFYKLAGVDLAVNTSTVNPAWVRLKRYNFVDRNKYIYPNSTSTIYGVYNQAYRIMGNQIQFIPVPAGNQTIRLWYAPRLPSLLLDTDLTTIGYSGWIRYPIVRAAKYCLDKEESDTSRLTEELLFLKTRIEQMASNRDEGEADTISETRTDGIYGGTGWGNGGGQGGW